MIQTHVLKPEADQLARTTGYEDSTSVDADPSSCLLTSCPTSNAGTHRATIHYTSTPTSADNTDCNVPSPTQDQLQDLFSRFTSCLSPEPQQQAISTAEASQLVHAPPLNARCNGQSMKLDTPVCETVRSLGMEQDPIQQPTPLTLNGATSNMASQPSVTFLQPSLQSTFSSSSSSTSGIGGGGGGGGAGVGDDVSSTTPLCVICEDKASGRHYGVISCEGCKGFFKRTVRRQLKYVCRDTGQCPVDRRKRTRCQACRYERCIARGMKREAVQEERHRQNPEHKGLKGPGLSVVRSEDMRMRNLHSVKESMSPEQTGTQGNSLSVTEAPSYSSGAQSNEPAPVPPPPPSPSPPPDSPKLTLSSLLAAELSTDLELPNSDVGEPIYVDIDLNTVHPLVLICSSIEQQLPRLLWWARKIPCFTGCLSVDDQFWLIKSAWPELLLMGAAYNSVVIREGLLLANGRHLSRDKAREHGLGPLLDRFLMELVSRFREMGLQRIELALLRAIILFNPDANNLAARDRVESIRESLYAALHAYCRASHANDTSRFTKLLLRLAPVRSIAHKCLEYLVFVKLAAEDTTSRRLLNLVEHGVWPSDDIETKPNVGTTRQRESQSV